MPKITYLPGPGAPQQAELYGIIIHAGETITLREGPVLDEALSRNREFEISGDRSRDLGDLSQAMAPYVFDRTGRLREIMAGLPAEAMTARGPPRLAAIEAEAGFKISTAERNALWAEMNGSTV